MQHAAPRRFYKVVATAKNESGWNVTLDGKVLRSPAKKDFNLPTAALASAIAADSAVLNATANPTGVRTTGWFRYDTIEPEACSDTFGTRAPDKDGAELGAGISPVPYAQTLSGLSPGTTYYYCAIASGPLGPRFGAVLSLTTKAAAPQVTTTPPTDVVSDAAVLSGAVVPAGAATTGWPMTAAA